MQVFLMEALLENYENNDSFLNVVSFQKQKNRIIFELLLVILLSYLELPWHLLHELLLRLTTFVNKI